MRKSQHRSDILLFPEVWFSTACFSCWNEIHLINFYIIYSDSCGNSGCFFFFLHDIFSKSALYVWFLLAKYLPHLKSISSLKYFFFVLWLTVYTSERHPCKEVPPCSCGYQYCSMVSKGDVIILLQPPCAPCWVIYWPRS